MHTQYIKEYASLLNRDVEYKIYGHGGKPCLVFPAQDKRFYDYEDHGMIVVLEPYLENGQLQIFAIDSVDSLSWSNQSLSEHERIANHEQWFQYVVEEFVPKVQKINQQDTKIMTTGCSMGATHALNYFLRRPDLFDSVIALSGVYHAGYFFGNYHDPLIYLNSITDYMTNFPLNHSYLDLYHQSKIILSVGQGAYEEAGIYGLHELEKDFKRLGLDNVTCDYWGCDVNHDWPDWCRQMNYYIEQVIK